MTTLTDRFQMLFRRRAAYRRCFQDSHGNLTPEGRAVLAHLATFCRADRSTLVVSPVTRTVDTHATMVAEGRREVFNKILQTLNITDEQLMRLRESADSE